MWTFLLLILPFYYNLITLLKVYSQNIFVWSCLWRGSGGLPPQSGSMERLYILWFRIFSKFRISYFSAFGFGTREAVFFNFNNNTSDAILSSKCWWTISSKSVPRTPGITTAPSIRTQDPSNEKAADRKVFASYWTSNEDITPIIQPMDIPFGARIQRDMIGFRPRGSTGLRTMRCRPRVWKSINTPKNRLRR